MAIVTDITNNILARVGTLLGPTYKVIPFVTDVSKNKFKGAAKCYGVLAGSASEVSGTVRAVTMEHAFSILLTDSYDNGAGMQLGDSLKALRIQELQDKAFSIYADLAKNKDVLSSGNILIVNNLTIDATEFLDEDKVAVQKININVRYRTQI